MCAAGHTYHPYTGQEDITVEQAIEISSAPPTPEPEDAGTTDMIAPAESETTKLA